jgi:hypothetical protein
MNGLAPNYNERSWAIDLIGHIKGLCAQANRSIKDAGGEQTVKAEGGSLFPDVLLFGDRATARILQGWELKMPDTPVTDADFKKNAEEKARALGLDSFLLWNVSHAHLYTRNTATDKYTRSKVWSDLADIVTRAGVTANKARWEQLATDIVGHLNALFDDGSLEGRQFIDAYRTGGITNFILENSGDVTEALKAAMVADAQLRARIILWWNVSSGEYAKGKMEDVLARANISNWIGKILFAHILREKDKRAQQIANIGDDTTPDETLALFAQLSEDCNFWTIFSDNSLGLSKIPQRAWDQLKQFNKLLTDLRVGSVDQAQLSGVLEATVEVATRKLRGQYPTPIELARLLTHLCVRDIVNDRVLDPCCGSGTIARAALEMKLTAGIQAQQASETIYASDQDPQAVQIATFALAKPAFMHMPVRIFQRDAFGLTPGLDIQFRNPSNGVLFTEQLGTFQTITSNLPFVAQTGRKQYGNALKGTLVNMGGGKFTGRADVAAYLPFAFYPLLAEGGRLGIIITNAWLGTDWGNDFYNRLSQYYDLKCVITSGAGRWFRNSKVVTNILIMNKKADPNQPSGEVNFVVLTRPLEDMADDEAVQIAAAQIQLGQTQNDTMTIRAVNQEDMTAFRAIGLGGNAQFVNCDWILNLPLVPLNKVFNIKRGERRGENDLFYPEEGHGIEAEYIKPLAKSPTEFDRLCAPPMKEAFSCSRSLQELEELGHTGAINWINNFATEATIKKLSRKGKYWYQMDTDAITDLVMFINFGLRLFVGRVMPRAFVDQRLVPLNPINEIDLDLHHALLNSTISMFIIEGMGFGRGMGALDLNKNKIEDYMHMLDASKLDAESIAAIKEAFAPLLGRHILSIADELEQEDRIAFDDAIIAAFELPVSRDEIYTSLLSLVEIRRTGSE